MTTVRQLLDAKGTDVWSIAPDASLFDALTLLAEKNIGALLVLEEEQLVGILSERDFVRKAALQAKNTMKSAVREIMTERVLAVNAQCTLEEAMALMTEKRFRHLPVVDEGKVIGVISIGDIVKSIIAHQEFMIEQLEKYIFGMLP